MATPEISFTVSRRKRGYRFDVDSPTGRARGWRPTREWAKSAARRELLDEMELEPSEDATFSSPSFKRQMDITLEKQRRGRGSRERASKRAQRAPRIVVAIAVVLVVLAAAVFGVRRWRSATADVASSKHVTIAVADHLRGTVFLLTDAFHKDHPDTAVSVWYGNTVDFLNEFKKGDVADVYLDYTENFSWLASYDVYATPAILGNDTMQLVVPTANPKGVRSIGDIGAGTKNRVGLCGPGLYCGLGAKSVFSQAGVNQPDNAFLAPTPEVLIDSVAKKSLDAALVFRSEFAGHRLAGLAAVDPVPPVGYRMTYALHVGTPNAVAAQFLDYATGSGAAADARAAMGLVGG